MTASAGDLDGLLNYTFTSSQYGGVAVQSFTLNQAGSQFLPTFTLATANVTMTGAFGPGATDGETFKIVAVNDTQSTVTVTFSSNGNVFAQQTDFVLGYNSSSILVSGNSSSTIATLLNSSENVDDLLGVISSSAFTPQSQQSYDVAGSFAEAPCFAAGTLLSTSEGEVKVEALRVGDLLILAQGGDAEVSWVGRRVVDCRQHPRPHDINPVRIRTGAFGPGKPARDLWLSPDHAVFVAGNLIPVRYLVNGRSVAQEQRAQITYFHVELVRHNVVLAEGLPCESYLDTGNRGTFTNGGPAIQLQPDFALRVWEAESCAPIMLEGPLVEAARRRLLRRAAALGYRTTVDPKLCVLADGRAVRFVRSSGRWRAKLPHDAREIRLVSRAWVPAHTRPHDNDCRQLGIAIGRLWLDGREVALDSPAFGAGWHAPETHWRWTDGDGALAVAGTRLLELQPVLTGTYWRDDEEPAARFA